jgi:hypothetical protein
MAGHPMFCPNCKAEYRQGFYRCKDCDVELVNEVVGDAPARDVEFEAAPLLWRGGDPATYAALFSALREAGIPFYDVQSQLRGGVSSASPFPSPYEAAACFEIRVGHLDLKRAEHILEALLDQEPEDLEIDEAGDGPAAAARMSPEEWDPAEASEEIWSGDDDQFAITLRDCLREISIPSRIVLLDPGNASLYVRPEDDSRAREILREITEATPPK